MSVFGELAALGAALCWTLSAALYKIVLSDAKPTSANISRCISTTLFLVACLFVTRKAGDLIALPTDVLAYASLSGVVGLCIGDTLYMISLKTIGISKAVPITAIYPLFTMLFEILLFGESVSLFILIGAISIIVGIWLISQEKDEANSSTREFPLRGVSVAFLAAVAWSISIILMDNAQKLSNLPIADTAFLVNTVRMFATTLLFLVLSPLADRRFHFLKLTRKMWIILALGGIVALGLGWFLLTVSLSFIQTSRAVPISSISPLFAAFFGAFLLNEKVTLRTFVGSVMVVLGIAGVFIA